MTTVEVRQAKLSWVAPSQNVDGSVLTDLAGFRVHWGDSSRGYTASRSVNNPAFTELTLDLTPGTYFFSVTAVDADGNESGFSNEVSKTII